MYPDNKNGIKRRKNDIVLIAVRQIKNNFVKSISINKNINKVLMK